MICVAEVRKRRRRIKDWEVPPPDCIVGLLVINSRFRLKISTCECPFCRGLEGEKKGHAAGIEVQGYCWLFLLQQEIDLHFCGNTTVLIDKSVRMNNSAHKYLNTKTCSIPSDHHEKKKVKKKKINVTSGSVVLFTLSYIIVETAMNRVYAKLKESSGFPYAAMYISEQSFGSIPYSFTGIDWRYTSQERKHS